MSLACSRHAAEEVPAADDNGNLNAQLLDFAEFGGNLVNAGWIDTKTLVRRQCFARYFEQNAFEDAGVGMHLRHPAACQLRRHPSSTCRNAPTKQ